MRESATYRDAKKDTELGQVMSPVETFSADKSDRSNLLFFFVYRFKFLIFGIMSGELVLVSGATGFVGAWVCKKAMEHGFRVRGTVRSLKNKEKVSFLENLCPGAQYPLELVEADLLNEESWTAAVKDCKYVLHTASPFFMNKPKHPDDLIKPAVDGTLCVLKAAADAGTVKRVVVTSSFAAVFEREQQKEGIFTEEDWSIPEKQQGIYERSKTLAEQAAWKYVQELPEDKKFELCTIQPVGIIGPVLSNNPATSVDIVVQLMNGDVPMLPKFYFPLVDVRDVADAHVRCLEVEEAAGKRFILYAENIFYPELGRWLSEEFKSQGYKVSTRQMPNPLMKLFSAFSSPLRLMRTMGENKIDISNARLREILGVTPIEIKKSVNEMAYALIEIGRVKKTDKYTGPPSQAADTGPTTQAAEQE
ncbi:NADPH-dependent aldehyde reductase ari1-like isoform x2 [Plakobranchus ocellatus]|uniref:NADPH-dependent aldehyde reductase ari1-like isoform x2 n=1 Tax=Plakobranchus ocellatus TaxID=259542 RepID=A0AAV3ZA71_9GAST|nr:NADPH-dependent aldehyde reductase ari1-like isoform x2 [Plakobranchus ocellatus]